MKFRIVFWDVLPCKMLLIIRVESSLMMEAARTSETSVDHYFTRQYIPEDKSELHARHRENLKSHETKYAGRMLQSRKAQPTFILSVFLFLF
jgi:hypothetical protein